jgi:hypothetical protein
MIIRRMMVLAMGFLALSSVSFAEELPLGLETKVVGNAHFERRYTFVPMHSDILCRGMPCPKSEPYWALVLDNDGVQYEMDHKFNLGEHVSPELIEVLGTVIRPGSRVMLDGQVEPLAENHNIVSHVTRATLVMDMDPQ